MLKMAIKTTMKAAKIMKDERVRINKAMNVAISTEAFRLRKVGAYDLKMGQLGLAPKAILRKKGGKKTRKSKPKAPLRGLFKGIICKIDRKNLTAEVGFLAASAGTAWQAKIAEKSIKGYRITYTPDMIKRLHNRGIHIRKDTHSTLVPARDIMGAVLAKTQNESVRNIKDNFARKLRGEWIQKE